MPEAYAATEAEPLPSSRADLADRLAGTDMSPDGVKAVVAVARPALVLDTFAVDEAALAPGMSKVGGRPDLPPHMAWPERSAYEAAGELAQAFRKEAADFYADVGLAPPWMPAAEATALIDARKRQRDEVRASTKELMAGVGADVGDLDFDALDSWKTPDLAREMGVSLLAKAEAVQKPFPLTFVAQLDLEALSRQPGFDPLLPKTGRLLFFYDFWMLPAPYEPRAGAGWRLIHDETPAADLIRTEIPPALVEAPGDEATVLRPVAVMPRSAVSTIPYGDGNWERLGLDEEDGSAYSDWVSSIGWPTEEGGGNHQLGGWPRVIQGNMQYVAQLAANGRYAGSTENYRTDEARRLLAEAGQWRLVLQVGRDEVAGQQLPGALYVMMREDDMKARRFDRAWVVYEQD